MESGLLAWLFGPGDGSVAALLPLLLLLLLLPLLSNLPRCSRAILNDARIISLDPALQSSLEILYAYPGFWALFWYRLSHALLQQGIPLASSVLPRLAMSVVRYATAIDIHPGADISSEGILIDHGVGLVVGATAVIGGGVTLYHGVTLGNSGKKLPKGAKRHPTIGDRVIIGAGVKILGDIVIGDDVVVGANSVVTKPVPRNHTAVGVPARVLCHGSATGKDAAGAAICELHRRLQQVEKDAKFQPQQQQQQQQQQPQQQQQQEANKAAVTPSSEKEAVRPHLQRAVGGQAAGDEEGRELRGSSPSSLSPSSCSSSLSVVQRTEEGDSLNLPSPRENRNIPNSAASSPSLSSSITAEGVLLGGRKEDKDTSAMDQLLPAHFVVLERGADTSPSSPRNVPSGKSVFREGDEEGGVDGDGDGDGREANDEGFGGEGEAVLPDGSSAVGEILYSLRVLGD